MRLPQWLRWRTNEELDEELQGHLEDAIQLNLDRGMSPKEARYAARRAVGNTTLIKERAREADLLFRFEMLGKDLRYAVRGLRRQQGFTFAAVMSLALGIGANTAIFSFLDAIMLRPIPVPRPQEIVRALGKTPSDRFERVSFRDYTEYRNRNHSLSGLAAEAFSPFALRARGQSISTYGHFVSGNFFSTLQVAPVMGRAFVAGDDASSAPTVAVILSHRIWASAFNADPALIGSAVRLNGKAATVVGVLPESFTGTDLTNRPQIYAPLATIGRLFPQDADVLTEPRRRSLNLWGRLKPGTEAETAQAEFVQLAAALASAYPESNRNWSISVLPEITSRFQGDPSNIVMIVLLLGIVALVLLVACTNVANLLLSRASARAAEIAIRMSVGATRGRLIGQFLTESFLLAAMGACGGLLLASWATAALRSIPIATEIPFEFALRIDSRVLLYTLGAMAASVLTFGLWPAFSATRPAPASPLRGGATAPKHRNRGRWILIAAQTALVSMALIAAGLFAQGFQNASTANPGFRLDNLLMATFNPQLAGYSDVQTKTFYADLERRVRAIPGVRSAALGSHAQLAPLSMDQDVVPAGKDSADQRNRRLILYNIVTPSFFETMDTPVLRGRAIDARDSAKAPPVAVINETMARELWPGQEALGQRIQLLDAAKTAEVVGIAQDGKYDDILEEPTPYFYVPFAQHTQSRMTLMVHTAGDPAELAPALRAEAKAVAAEVPVTDVQTMRRSFDQMGLLLPRLMAQLIGVLAAIGLAIGVTGLYAVIAFVVSQRTREFGIRMALGASPSLILRGVLAGGVKIALAGLAIGAAAAWALTGYFAAFLARVDPHEPVVFGGVTVLLLAIALAACWIPARRASLVDPAVTLRQE